MDLENILRRTQTPTVTQTLISWTSNARAGKHTEAKISFALGEMCQGEATANHVNLIFSSNTNVLELDNGDVYAVSCTD